MKLFIEYSQNFIEPPILPKKAPIIGFIFLNMNLVGRTPNDISGLDYHYTLSLSKVFYIIRYLFIKFMSINNHEFGLRRNNELTVLYISHSTS